MNPTRSPLPAARGVSLIEVLVTLVVLAFGLLGIAALQAKAQIGAVESYQRAQAVVLLQDMRARLAGNPNNAASYVTTDPLGTNDAQPTDCTTVAAGAARDQCEWSHALKGAAIAGAVSGNTGSVVIGARGCIEQLQAPNAAAGVCQPGIYRVSVAWQGLHPTRASPLLCGKDLYGADTNRRAIAVRVAIGLPHCS